MPACTVGNAEKHSVWSCLGRCGAEMESPTSHTVGAVPIARTEKSHSRLQMVTKAPEDNKLFLALRDHLANLRREVGFGLNPEA